MQKRGGAIASESRAEREEELALFHEVRRRERERKSNAVHPLPPHDADLVGSSNTFMQHQKAPSTTKFPLTQTSTKLVHDPLPADLNKKDDDLLTAELGKNDYDWLLTPPGTPLINSLDQNSASNGDDFLSRAAPFSSGRTLAAIKTSRFSSTKAEPNFKKDGAILSTKPDLALRRGQGQNSLTRSNGSTNSSSYLSNNGTPMGSKKTSLTPGARSSSRPTSPTKRPISSAHTSHPTTPTSRSKPSSAPGSHPTTPTSRPTTALPSRGGNSSVLASSMMTRKTGTSSPAMTPIRRLSGPQTHSQPSSSGVSRSSSVSKARPLLSRSVPSSRGSSPTTKPLEWLQGMATPVFCSESESLRTSLTTNITANSYAKTSRSTPHSMNSRGSPVGSLSRQGATSLTSQTVFSSSDQTATSLDMSRKAYSPDVAIAKSNLLGISRTERQSSNGWIMSSVQMNKSQDTVVRNVKDADKPIQHSNRSLGLLPSPETTWSALQPKHLLAKSISPASSRDHGGFNKQGPRRSLDLTVQHLGLHQGTSNGLCSLVSSTSFLSSRHTETQNCAHNLAAVSNGNASADYITIASFEQDGSEVGEEFLCGSNFLESPASQSDHLSSLVKDARINNWLGSQDYMGENLMQVFEQCNDRLEKCESPLVCPHGGGGAINCDLCNVKMRLQMLNEKSKANFGANSQILGEKLERVSKTISVPAYL